MYTRSRKESHLQTVQYEIDMLLFCFERLPKRITECQRQQYLVLEGFLLHYRNLVEFFSGSHHRHENDLSMRKPSVWAAHVTITMNQMKAITQSAKHLDKKYFVPISRYLQHCTEDRHLRDLTWDCQQMHDEILPIISMFHALS